MRNQKKLFLKNENIITLGSSLDNLELVQANCEKFLKHESVEISASLPTDEKSEDYIDVSMIWNLPS